MLYKKKRIFSGRMWIRIKFNKRRLCTTFCISNNYCHIPILINKYTIGLFKDICCYKYKNDKFVVYVIEDCVNNFNLKDIFNI